MRTILFLGASPSNERRLAIGREADHLRDVLRKAKLRDLDVHHRASTTYERFRDALLEVKPTYLHLSCHGEAGCLIFEDERGSRERISNQAIIDVLAVARSVEGVVVNACNSVALAERLATGARFAIGMRDAIGDEAALAYADGFYSALATDASPADCDHLGRCAIRKAGLGEDSLPKLFLGPSSRASSLRALQDQLDALEREVALGAEPATPDQRARRRAIREQMRPTDQVQRGVCFAGRYELLEELGRGGFARVWKAYDLKLKRPVAIKVLHRDLAGQSEDRFFRGARAMQRLAAHPNVVEILEPEGHFEERAFFVMELLDRDLTRWLAEAARSPAEIVQIIRSIGSALDHAHAQGLVHRDVKPANILLSSDGRPKLSDFDLVRADDSAAQTRTGGLGAFIYAAPECWTHGKSAGPAADQFSLAMTTLCLLYGEPLPTQAFRRTERFIARLPAAEPFAETLLRALEDAPAERFESVGHFVGALGTTVEVDVAVSDSSAGTDEFGEYEEVEISGVSVRFRRIRAGSFIMGSPQGEVGRFDREGPQHRVRVTDDFWLADTQVTQELWMAVMGANPSRFKHPARPVERVSWEDVYAFIAELSRQGLNVRLPTEAQWEYACRAGRQTATWLGDLKIQGLRNAPLLDGLAWYGGNSGVDLDIEGYDSSGWSAQQYRSKRSATRIVKQKIPNPWGLYDMLGNVWEWCADWFADYLSTEQTNPEGPARGSERVLRGGAWDSNAWSVRAACRSAISPDNRLDDVGFRLARGVRGHRHWAATQALGHPGMPRQQFPYPAILRMTSETSIAGLNK